ncbi:MAG: hypothetical protein Q8Q28_08620 [Pseudomonadota bacterium]|nr:hypothetical protein [Pseudomonadota bacterium]
MKAMQRTTLMLALAGVLAMPTALLAADAAKDEHSGHHPEAAAAPAATVAATATPTADATPADLMPAMRDRMRQMRQIQDPAKRMEMMGAQMKDLETMMQGPNRSCPKADAKGGMGMMGDKCGMGMMGGKGGKGMMGQGMPGQDDMMAKRMEMMEKRLDMMQMMMQMRMQGMGGGMGPGMGMGMPGN